MRFNLSKNGNFLDNNVKNLSKMLRDLSPAIDSARSMIFYALVPDQQRRRAQDMLLDASKKAFEPVFSTNVMAEKDGVAVSVALQETLADNAENFGRFFLNFAAIRSESWTRVQNLLDSQSAQDYIPLLQNHLSKSDDPDRREAAERSVLTEVFLHSILREIKRMIPSTFQLADKDEGPSSLPLTLTESTHKLGFFSRHNCGPAEIRRTPVVELDALGKLRNGLCVFDATLSSEKMNEKDPEYVMRRMKDFFHEDVHYMHVLMNQSVPHLISKNVDVSVINLPLRNAIFRLSTWLKEFSHPAVLPKSKRRIHKMLHYSQIPENVVYSGQKTQY